MIRRNTPLDGLPLATALLLCAGLFWWVGRSGDLSGEVRASGEPVQLARATPRSAERVGTLEPTPWTPWGDRSLDELLERIFDPPVLRSEVERRSLGGAGEGDRTLGDTGGGEGARPEPRWVVLRGVDGRSLAEGRTVGGVPDGPWSFRDGSGGRQAAGMFRAGVADGPWHAWHEDGTPRSELAYDEGQPEGRRIEWWPNGVRALEGEYTDGLRSGLWRTWHETGALRSEGHYGEGLREGSWGEWHPDGSVRSSATYVQGMRQGEWRQWHPGGAVAEEGRFVDGQREGWWVFFNPAGERDRRSGYYLAGLRQRE